MAAVTLLIHFQCMVLKDYILFLVSFSMWNAWLDSFYELVFGSWLFMWNLSCSGLGVENPLLTFSGLLQPWLILLFTAWVGFARLSLWWYYENWIPYQILFLLGLLVVVIEKWRHLYYVFFTAVTCLQNDRTNLKEMLWKG